MGPHIALGLCLSPCLQAAWRSNSSTWAWVPPLVLAQLPQGYPGRHMWLSPDRPHTYANWDSLGYDGDGPHGGYCPVGSNMLDLHACMNKVPRGTGCEGNGIILQT